MPDRILMTIVLTPVFNAIAAQRTRSTRRLRPTITLEEKNAFSAETFG